MALTNDQITAQNFKDFYEQIRPYLNGQVPTFANQFSRSDLYSTDEKIIGQWIDGKPIYQKTVSCGALPNNTEKLVAHSISNIDRIISYFGSAAKDTSPYATISMGYWGGTVEYSISVSVDNSNIHIYTSSDRSSYKNAYVTIQYTKTTDSAIKVGTGTDYSTEEQIIGTWIDGKPLYQKTIDFGALPNNTTKSVNHNIQNIDYVVNLFGAAYRSSDGIVNTLPCYNHNVYGAELVSNSTSIMVTTFADRSTFSESYVTIQYTKSTD